MNIDLKKLSIIIPARNEEEGLALILPELVKTYENAEIIVVNDASTDNTEDIALKNGVTTVVTHPYAMGNGAAIKTGARTAKGDILVFMDADGQHEPHLISQLLEKFEQGFDMVVGARSSSSQASIGRLFANTIYNKFASFMVGQNVDDLTSGLRVADAKKFRKFIYLYPNGFSYPTTSTMAFFRSGFSVGYVKVKTNRRKGKSHINLAKDGVRFLLILFKIGTLYSPLKIFFPFSFFIFLMGLSYYLYTYITTERFTNMSALMFTTSVIIFLMGLVSEQIANLYYSKTDQN